MPWPVHPTGFFGASGDNDTYRIERSLRFNSADSAYLNRTPNAGSGRQKFTISFWTKKTKIGNNAAFVESYFNGSNFFLFGVTGADDRVILYDYQGGTDYGYVYSPAYRDVSAWYHFMAVVDTTNATANQRFRLYVNGEEVTAKQSDYGDPPQNHLTDFFNTGFTHSIGRRLDAGTYYDGLMTEFYIIDGQALTPSSFGETDAITGRWKAKAYSGGSYGTNGFYLNFSDNSSLTTTSNVGIGKDFSGNGNYWATNGLSVTAGTGNDSLVDSPTNYGTDTGVGGEVRGNYCTLNPLSTTSGSFVQGNLRYTGPSDWRRANGTMAVSSGKWYYEVTLGNAPFSPRNSSSYYNAFGFGVATSFNSSTGPGSITDGVILGDSGYYKNFSGSNTDGGTAFSSGDILSIAVDLDGNTYTFRRNNTQIATGTIGGTAGRELVPIIISYDGSFGVMDVNFGQRPFAYGAPFGFMPLCTTLLPKPTIQKPSKHFDVVTYTGTGSALTPTSSLGFSPDLVWIKGRSGATDHALYDTVRGVEKRLESNNTDAEVTSDGGVTAFNSNGFTLGTLAQVNTSSATYVAWAWDEAPIAGMDIVSYTGNGANRTIAHNLGVAPKFVIVKRRDTGSSPWMIWHNNLTSGTYYLSFSTAAQASGPTRFTASPTSSVINVGTDGDLNASGGTYIAYLFAEVEGFSKFGSYTGNGATGGPFVWCGFRPSVVIAKSTGGTGNWTILDYQREGYNVDNDPLFPNLSNAEGTTDLADFLSNGFKIRTTDASFNTSGSGYIFSAWSESPFKYARAR